MTHKSTGAVFAPVLFSAAVKTAIMGARKADPPVYFREKLTQSRKTRGMRQADGGQISRQAIGKWETGDTRT